MTRRRGVREARRRQLDSAQHGDHLQANVMRKALLALPRAARRLQFDQLARRMCGTARICPEMVTIPAGGCVPGSHTCGSLSAGPDELPERTIVIRESFAVSRYEITLDQNMKRCRVRGREPSSGRRCLSDRRQRGNWVYDAETDVSRSGLFAGRRSACCLRELGTKPGPSVDWLNTQELEAFTGC
jgi:formylglycine-generating enzyme required for sulfatase activity